MSKRHLTFVCQNCGAAYNRWQGKCEACGEWNTLSEEGSDKPAGPGRKPGKGRLFQLQDLAGDAQDAPRIASGIGELDRVTGGGFVRGSVLLLGGDPGIGKSTLLIQATAALARAGVADRIQVHVGDALEVLSERKEQFDVLFCDIDKPDYPRAARMAPERVRRGGLFITDNTLWRGDVVYAAGNPDYKPEYQPDQKLRAIVEFNGMLYQSPDWFTTIVPLRDGVTVAMRL